ncbi:hypothetical protein [Alicyclobacillus acidiphilus]|uniref:hypothetical protein n=1 Tax=Alicyclobacillus acidiphilus TaxID=182455 RepID=UPI00082C5DC6|nr:hypothetical protein [Alicyclobacillus acidiphilus]MCL6444300.1 hypothetical protein [Alicyclobacillus sp.]
MDKLRSLIAEFMTAFVNAGGLKQLGVPDGDEIEVTRVLKVMGEWVDQEPDKKFVFTRDQLRRWEEHCGNLIKQGVKIGHELGRIEEARRIGQKLIASYGMSPEQASEVTGIEIGDLTLQDETLSTEERELKILERVNKAMTRLGLSPIPEDSDWRPDSWQQK